MVGHKRTISQPHTVSPKLQVVRESAYRFPDKFVQTQLKVVDKDANVFQFKYNYPQLQMAETIQLQESQGRPVRMFFLKSRQVGTSTMMAARNFTRCWAKDNVECILLAHFEDRASELLERVKQFYQSMDPRLKLALSRDSKFSFQFADIRSKMTIASARNIEQVKGGTKQHGHLTEFPYMKKPMHVLEEISQPIARRAGTSIIIETTGYGYDSDAHKFWKSCKAKKEIFGAHFLAWQDDPTCVAGVGLSDRALDYELARAFEYEKRLRDRMKQHKLGVHQVLYAYEQLRDQLYGNWEKYLQEYPCDDDEAWRNAEGSWFGAEYVNYILRSIEEDVAEFFSFEQTTLSQKFETFNALTRIDAVKNENDKDRPPFLKVWRNPNDWSTYLIVSDSAGGGPDGNCSSTFVLDLDTLEQVAEFNGRVRPDEHAYIAGSLADIYNGALCVPEINNHGHAMLQVLKGLNVRIYKMKDVSDNKTKERNRLGWVTDVRSRNLALAALKRIVEDIAKGNLQNTGIFRSRALIREMMTFVEREIDKPEAAPGQSDDRVMAEAIGVAVCIQETMGGDKDVLRHLYGAMEKERSEKSGLIYTPRQDPSDVIQKIEDEILGGYGFNGYFVNNGGGGNENGWFE